MLQVGTAGGPFFLMGNNKQVTAPISKSACSKTRGQPLNKLKIDPAEVLREGKKPRLWLFSGLRSRGGWTRPSKWWTVTRVHAKCRSTSKSNKTQTLRRPQKSAAYCLIDDDWIQLPSLRGVTAQGWGVIVQRVMLMLVFMVLRRVVSAWSHVHDTPERCAFTT